LNLKKDSELILFVKLLSLEDNEPLKLAEVTLRQIIFRNLGFKDVGYKFKEETLEFALQFKNLS